MTYNEFTQTQEFIQFVQNQWQDELNVFLTYLHARFSFRHLLYSPAYCVNFINRTILDFYYDLKKAEQSAEMVRTTTITKDNLGYQSQNMGEVTNSATGTDTTSYMGYNVDSDYNRNRMTNEVTSNTTHTNKNLNLVNELQNYIGVNMDAYYDSIANEISKLFRRIY